MPELAQSEDEHVLPGTAGIHEPRMTAMPPILQTEIVELLEVLRYHEWRDVVLEAFFEEDETPDAAVAILKRVDLLEADMKVKQILERLFRILPP